MYLNILEGQIALIAIGKANQYSTQLHWLEEPMQEEALTP